ncbi:MAG: methionine--tRNA ligase [Candidatus Paceibacterota bacterium]|jgi:methionyl-tRNA synthetase
MKTNSSRFYITTTLPYVNAKPHLGFAMEIIRADIIARYHGALGEEVFFNTGTDEHGQKIYDKAIELGQTPQAYVDELAEKFRDLITPLGISSDIHFIRTTDQNHIEAAQEFWRQCDHNGFIYKKNYQTKYCVGCELEKTDSELVDGKCPLHSNLILEIRDEENYFFKFSAFGDKLLAFYEARPDFIFPAERVNEMKALIERGLQDFSISRLATKMSWGIPVPGDETQVMYVWFDALVNYVSAVGWPDDQDSFKKWWLDNGGVVQYCGKDNLRQQTAMWQAMLMAADIPNSKCVIVEGFVTSGGQKMSKSAGNVVDPLAVVEKYGTDALRYFVAGELAMFEDSDFTWERFHDAYNSKLANGLGNLVSRVMKMSESYLPEPVTVGEVALPDEFKKWLDVFDIGRATDLIWQKITELDLKIQATQPFKLIKEARPAAEKIVAELVQGVAEIAEMLSFIMPATAEKIKVLIKENKMPEPLFLRKN